MSREVYTFSPGPCIFPIEVLEQTRQEITDKKHNILEYDHTSPEIKALVQECKQLVKTLLKVPDNFTIIFMQGGATFQFSAVPLNLMSSKDSVGNYIVNGAWSEAAFAECNFHAKGHTVNPSQDKKSWNYAPKINEADVNKAGSYFYYCDNETVHGVEFAHPPNNFGLDLVTDMTSNFMSKPIDFTKFGIVYAGAQKNWGPAGLCTVIIRNDLLKKKGMDTAPSSFKYSKYAETDSFYSLPPIFSLYTSRNNLRWITKNGGVEAMDEFSKKKSQLLYDCIDNSNGFYINKVAKDSRSRMNVIFIILNDDKDLSKAFVSESEKEGLIQLAGHRSVGGLRASIYNGMPMEGVVKLRDFMEKFRQKYQNRAKL